MNLHLEHNTANIGDLQMIPLINVVFLMLAFILITGNIEKSNQNNPALQELVVPSSTSNLDQEVHDITVTLDQNGTIFLDDNETTIQRLGEDIRLAASKIASTKVLIRADASVAAQSTREVLKHLRDVGLRKISLATVRTRLSSN